MSRNLYRAARSAARRALDSLDNIVHQARLRTLAPLRGQEVLLGPWLGEVGSELQYWIPYLLKLRHEGYFGRQRVIALSRGGVDEWYRHVADEYLELFEYADPAEIRDIRSGRFGEKQFSWVQGERALVERIARRKGLARFAVIHPSVMWIELQPWLAERRTMRQSLNWLAFQAFDEPNPRYANIVDALNLPPEFIVVRFYSSYLFPASESNSRFIAGIVNRLALKHAVVVMGLSSGIDEHVALSVDLGRHVIDISSRLEPATNLGIQTEVIRRARLFVGTYGGFSVLPAFLGKPALCFYSEPLRQMESIHFQHEAITTWLYQHLGGQPYLVMTVKSWEGIEDAMLDATSFLVSAPEACARFD